MEFLQNLKFVEHAALHVQVQSIGAHVETGWRESGRRRQIYSDPEVTRLTIGANLESSQLVLLNALSTKFFDAHKHAVFVNKARLYKRSNVLILIHADSTDGPFAAIPNLKHFQVVSAQF